MWIAGGTVLTVSSRALVGACAKLGVDVSALLEEAGITRETLADPDARSTTAQVGALWSRAYGLSGDPDLALHAVEALPFGAYRVVDFLASNAPTVGAAFEQIAAHLPIINTTVQLSIRAGSSEVEFRVEGRDASVAVSRPYAEYTLGAVVLRIRSMLGIRSMLEHPLPLVAVEFAAAAPAFNAEHKRIFRCPVRFEQPHHRLIVSRSTWEDGNARADANLFAVLERHARDLLTELPNDDPVISEARQAIEACFSGQAPSIEGTARRMGVSTRTLQRRLQRAGVSHNDLVDEARHAQAVSYLSQQDVAIAEIAYVLGFSDQSAFTRAFKRWTGSTPAMFRRQARPYERVPATHGRNCASSAS